MSDETLIQELLELAGYLGPPDLQRHEAALRRAAAALEAAQQRADRANAGWDVALTALGVCQQREQAMFSRVLVWEASANDPLSPTRVTIEQRRRRDGAILWCVKRFADVLARNGEWEYEPIPSSRDDAFTERTRYATFNEAEKYALAALSVPESTL